VDSLRPAGVLHGPHLSSYEGSIGMRSTDELAVMMGFFAALSELIAFGRACRG
jgi:homogentisate 1,2-dioxygenase